MASTLVVFIAIIFASKLMNVDVVAVVGIAFFPSFKCHVDTKVSLRQRWSCAVFCVLLSAVEQIFMSPNSCNAETIETKMFSNIQRWQHIHTHTHTRCNRFTWKRAKISERKVLFAFVVDFSCAFIFLSSFLSKRKRKTSSFRVTLRMNNFSLHFHKILLTFC